MKKVLVTGAKGFIGRNLCARFLEMNDVDVFQYDIDNTEAELETWLSLADIVFHLAGVNRPEDVEQYEQGNAGFTKQMCDHLRRMGRTPKIVMSSSVQAELENPYGISKRRAEEHLQAFARETGAIVSICRLKNVFGKWCRPEYNSVTATFCHHIANDLPITISDPKRGIDLIYIDDVIECFVNEFRAIDGDSSHPDIDPIPSTVITLGDLAGRIQAFHEMRMSLLVPDLSERFNQALYATYLSYVKSEELEYGLEVRADPRGTLAEFVKSEHFGQIFVSRTRPGMTRGNHYHHTKTEKFLVLEGQGLIKIRQIHGNDVEEYQVNGQDYRVIDIAPGYTHSITNVGQEEMVTLFWASEVFDPDRPDTYYLDVEETADTKLS